MPKNKIIKSSLKSSNSLEDVNKKLKLRNLPKITYTEYLWHARNLSKKIQQTQRNIDKIAWPK